MARTAFVLGGTGFIGSVVARRFVEGGWDVTVASRGQLASPPGLDGIPIRRAELDRTADGELASALGDGVDALVDIVAYSRGDAAQLAALGDRMGTLLVISTGAVYVDGHGRHLFASYRTDPLPDVPVPIPESQATVRPDDETYPGQKAAVEQTLVEANSAPTSIVRAPAVFGPGDVNSREWYFVKRALDGRRHIALHDCGENVYQTVFVENLAELIYLAAEQPANRVINAGDEDPLTALARARLVANAMDHDWAEVLLPGPPPREFGPWDASLHPWSVARPFVFDLSRARDELAYRPVVSHDAAIERTCTWLRDVTAGREWSDVLNAPPEVWETEAAIFDYEAEDEYLRTRLDLTG